MRHRGMTPAIALAGIARRNDNIVHALGNDGVIGAAPHQTMQNLAPSLIGEVSKSIVSIVQAWRPVAW